LDAQLEVTIAKDLKLTKQDVANSNILALTATLLVRLVAGPACDRYGPRITFAASLLIGAVPTALAGTAFKAPQLLALRFFIGILGGSFVPCQVWTTGFFDKNVVGTANAFTAGLGNAGGGITYFLMPAIFDSLVRDQGLSAHVAWRVAFIVPFICITATAIGMLLLCPDTPTGKWSERHLAVQQNLSAHGVSTSVVDKPGNITDKKLSDDGSSSPPSQHDDKPHFSERKASHDNEAQMGSEQMLEIARGEVIVKPTFKEGIKVVFTPQVLVTAGGYFCSFGAELAINSILGGYYLAHFPKLGQTGSGRWAAMFGLLNVFFRPAGGLIADFIYNRTHSVWLKKIWLHALGVVAGCFLLAIGLVDSYKQATMFGLVAGLAFFMDAGNGANFALVPHVHPQANGIVSGVTGAAGNFGGIIFAIIFRYHPTDRSKVMWIIGVMTIGINLALSWIQPIPKGQIGGR
jgi:MFS transporter, NNP family, nitrate/nitrite transporter